MATLSPLSSNFGFLHPNSGPPNSAYPASCPSSPFRYDSSESSAPYKNFSILSTPASPYKYPIERGPVYQETSQQFWDDNGNKHFNNGSAFNLLEPPAASSFSVGNSSDNNGNSSSLAELNTKQEKHMKSLNLDDSSTFRDGLILDAQTADYLLDVPDFMIHEEVLQKCIEQIQLQNKTENMPGDGLDLNKFNAGFSSGNNYSSESINVTESNFSLCSLQSKQNQKVIDSRQTDLMAASLPSSEFPMDRFHQQRSQEQFQHQWQHLHPQQQGNHSLHQQQHTLFSHLTPDNPNTVSSLSKPEYSRGMESLASHLSKIDMSSVSLPLSPQITTDDHVRLGQTTFQDSSSHTFPSALDCLPTNLTFDPSMDSLSSYPTLSRSRHASPMRSSTYTHSRPHSLSVSTLDIPSPQLLSPIPPRIPLPHEVSRVNAK